MEHRDADPGVDPAAGALRGAAQVSVVTALARVAGFTRWIVLGLTVGATYLGNVYQTANWVPNVVFELFAGGILSAVFVPTFVAELERGRERGIEIASSLANIFLLASIPIVVLGAFAARPLMQALTVAVPDAGIRAEQIELGAWFLWFFLPQIPLYMLAMVMTGVLHAHHRFVIPAAAPLLSSLVVIATYLTFHVLGPGADLGTVSRTQLFVLAGGTTGGVLLLAACQVPSVMRTGMRWRPVVRWRDPSVRKALRMGVWGAAFFAVHQAGLLVTLVLANRVEGGVVAFQVAYAFFELPNALVGLPIAIVLFPSLTRAAVRRSEREYARLLSSGWRVAVFLAAPAAAGLFVLAPALSEAILGRGGPAEAAPALVGSVLRGLAVGLPAFALVQVLARSFYARHETRPPVALQGTSSAVYALIVIPVTFLLLPQGSAAMSTIGFSHAAGQWAGIGVGIALLAARVHGWGVGADLRVFARCLVRAAAMGAVVWLVLTLTSPVAIEIGVVAGISAGLCSYLLLAVRSPELRGTWDLLRGVSR